MLLPLLSLVVIFRLVWKPMWILCTQYPRKHRRFFSLVGCIHTHTYIDLLWKFIASSITIGRRDESWQHENIFYIIIAQLSTITLWKFVISINKWWKMLPRCTLSFSSPCSAPRWWMRILFYYYFSHFKASGWCLLMIHL